MGFLTENLGWKMLSLGLALVLWFLFIRDPAVATFVSVPVQYMGLPGELEMSSEFLEQVQLELHGPSSRLGGANLNDAAVILKLSGVHRSGDYTFPINGGSVNLPTGVSLSRAIPSQLRLRFERRLSPEVPVQVRFAGPPPMGYRLARQEVEPESLRIVGPESRVRSIEFVQTDPIDLSGVVAEAEFRVHAFVQDPLVRFASPSPVVKVKVFMQKIQ